MKSKSKVVVSIAISAGAVLSLTACDPPMPPEVIAALAEQTYTCVDGTGKIAFTSGFTSDVYQGFVDSLTYSDCATSMFLEPTDSFADADLIVSDYAPDVSECQPVSTVPFALDAGVFLYQLADAGSVNFSIETAKRVLSGEITNWSDPALVEDNPQTTMPDLPLTLRLDADENALKSVIGLAFGDNDLSRTQIVGAKQNDVNLFTYPEEGELVVAPNSFAVALGLYPVNIRVNNGDPTLPENLATPDANGFFSAGTQLVPTVTGDSVTLKLDPSIAPTPPQGLDEISQPYQALYPVNMYKCEDTLVNRALSRFLLRLDSQGSIGFSSYIQQPESSRTSGLTVVSKGLPTPEPVQ